MLSLSIPYPSNVINARRFSMSSPQLFTLSWETRTKCRDQSSSVPFTTQRRTTNTSCSTGSRLCRTSLYHCKSNRETTQRNSTRKRIDGLSGKTRSMMPPRSSSSSTRDLEQMCRSLFPSPPFWLRTSLSSPSLPWHSGSWNTSVSWCFSQPCGSSLQWLLTLFALVASFTRSSTMCLGSSWREISTVTSSSQSTSCVDSVANGPERATFSQASASSPGWRLFSWAASTSSLRKFPQEDSQPWLLYLQFTYFQSSFYTATSLSHPGTAQVSHLQDTTNAVLWCLTRVTTSDVVVVFKPWSID